MAPDSSKRRAKSPNSPRSPKKPKTLDEKVQVVSKTLSDSRCLVSGPEAHREMLLASIPHTLSIPSDERHEFQTQLTQMIQQVLTDHVADHESQVATSKAEVDANGQKFTEQMNVVEASAAMIKVQEETVKKGKDEVSENSEAVTAAENTLASAKKEVAEFDSELQKTIDKKDHCAEVYNNCFTLLKSGVTDKKEVPKLVKMIEPTLKQFPIEISLLSAIAPALKKAPGDRGAFDHMAIEGAESNFTKNLGELKEYIDKADVMKTAKVTAEANAQEVLTAATEKHTASEAALKDAKDVLKSLNTKHKELLEGLDEASKIECKGISHHATKEGGLAHAKDVLASFTELVERTSTTKDKATDKPEGVEEVKSTEKESPSPGRRILGALAGSIGLA